MKHTFYELFFFRTCIDEFFSKELIKEIEKWQSKRITEYIITTGEIIRA